MGGANEAAAGFGSRSPFEPALAAWTRARTAAFSKGFIGLGEEMGVARHGKHDYGGFAVDKVGR